MEKLYNHKDKDLDFELRRLYKEASLFGVNGVPITRTVNGKALSDDIVLGLASADFANQGTTTTVLHGNAGGNPSFGSIVNADVDANANVLFSKLATTNTGVVLGRQSALGGAVEEITCTAAGRALLDDATAAIQITTLGAVPDTRTVNSKALSANITLDLASADFANQGTTTTVLHGNASGNPAFGAVVETDITLANNTTNNVSTTKHGFCPIVPVDATKGLSGVDGTWGIVGYSPIGAIIAWHKSFANTPALPSNWVECNGQTLSNAGSVYNGQVIPNLNGAAAGADLNSGDNLGKTGDVFLRGDETSGATQLDMFQGHLHQPANYVLTSGSTYPSGGTFSTYTAMTIGSPITDGVNGTPRTGSITRPRNMSIVWIMRIL
jgi:hypothetical protein